MLVVLILGWELRWAGVQTYDRYGPGASTRKLQRLHRLRDHTARAIEVGVEVASRTSSRDGNETSGMTGQSLQGVALLKDRMLKDAVVLGQLLSPSEIRFVRREPASKLGRLPLRRKWDSHTLPPPQ